ncbi:MAG: DUF1800 family protein [Bryobacteraceae bacterium]
MAKPATLRDSSDRRHLLRRLTFGTLPADEAALGGKPVAAAFQSLWDAAKKAAPPKTPAPAQGTWTNKALRFTDTSSAEIVAKRAEVTASNARDAETIRQWWLQEMISGPSPLRENLVLFFHSVFGGSGRTIDGPHALYGYNALLRRACFGTIPAMLDAMILDPGMIMQESYDETKSEKPSEFSAGRILDNWTVGVGNYTPSDAMSLARAITGWVLEAPKGQEPTKPLDPLAFRSNRRTGLVPVFHPEFFDSGLKTILGTTRGFGARDAIQFLALHDATARRFSKLLIRYFGVEDAAHRLESELAATYRATQGSIEALVRTLVLSDEFWSQGSRWKLVKSPVHLAVGACRQLELSTPPVAAISAWLAPAGQKILEAPNFGGDGWPGQEAWLAPTERLAARYQLGAALFGGTTPWGLLPLAVSAQAGTPGRLPNTVQEAPISALVSRLDPAPGMDASVLERSLSAIPAEKRAQQAVIKILAMPEYQVA